MKNKDFILFIFLFIIRAVVLNAQTVNSGELSVRPGTVFSTIASFDNAATGDVLNDGTLMFYGNYNNNGLIGFTPKSALGLVHFKGLFGAQTISGSILSQFNNVRFENNNAVPAFLLKAEISIAGCSDFVNGIIDNENYPGAVIFEANAIHRYAGNDSYVAGYVERNQNNPFEFPIGDGGFFRPSSIGVSDPENNVFRSKYIWKDSNIQFPHNQKEPAIQIIDNTEYWYYESSQKQVESTLTLSWDVNTTPQEIIENKPGTNLAIVRWNEAEKKWKAYSTALDFDNRKAVAAVRDNGIFTFARVLEEASDNLVIYNAVSPNNDGLNDYFRIDGLESFPDNVLQIYNRWGVKVYETKGYGLNDNFFRGFSEGRATLNKGERLPAGTYFYILIYKNPTKAKEKAGYLYIN